MGIHYGILLNIFSPKLLDIYNRLMSEREAEEGYIDIYY